MFGWIREKVGDNPGMTVGMVVGGTIGSALGPSVITTTNLKEQNNG
jgi:hypothetical protein